jgi:beta-1,4-mannosyl-glycoprotein beta-1,4-N-acetylglucosaminyltransferase
MLNELDWLEIRLHTLAPFVDYFVILESPITFTGHPKHLIFQKNRDRFQAWEDKITHKVLENPPCKLRLDIETTACDLVD